MKPIFNIFIFIFSALQSRFLPLSKYSKKSKNPKQSFGFSSNSTFSIADSWLLRVGARPSKKQIRRLGYVMGPPTPPSATGTKISGFLVWAEAQHSERLVHSHETLFIRGFCGSRG